MHLDNTSYQVETSISATNMAKCLKTCFPIYKFDQVASLAIFLDPHFKVVEYHKDEMFQWQTELKIWL